MAEKKKAKKVAKKAVKKAAKSPVKSAKKTAPKAKAKKVVKAAAKATAKAAKVAAKATAKAAKVAAKAAPKMSPRKRAAKSPAGKKAVIQKHALHQKDTGSAQVQVAILTHRINSLQGHLKDHPNDLHSKKGLLTMVGKRRKHLDYLKSKKIEVYNELIEELGLRK